MANESWKGWLKLGRSEDPVKRVKGLQIGTPHKGHLLCTLSVPDTDISKLEIRLQRELLVQGALPSKNNKEWFFVDYDIAKDVLETQGVVHYLHKDLTAIEFNNAITSDNILYKDRVVYNDIIKDRVVYNDIIKDRVVYNDIIKDRTVLKYNTDSKPMLLRLKASLYEMSMVLNDEISQDLKLSMLKEVLEDMHKQTDSI